MYISVCFFFLSCIICYIQTWGSRGCESAVVCMYITCPKCKPRTQQQQQFVNNFATTSSPVVLIIHQNIHLRYEIKIIKYTPHPPSQYMFSPFTTHFHLHSHITHSLSHFLTLSLVTTDSQSCPSTQVLLPAIPQAPTAIPPLLLPSTRPQLFPAPLPVPFLSSKSSYLCHFSSLLSFH